jgi:hypothetical protein
LRSKQIHYDEKDPSPLPERLRRQKLPDLGRKRGVVLVSAGLSANVLIWLPVLNCSGLSSRGLQKPERVV